MQYTGVMRTTLDIDPDVLQAAKELAKREHKTAGQVVSDLLRSALNQRRTENSDGSGREVQEERSVYGIQPFTSRGGVVTNQLIDELKDEFNL